MSDTLNQQLFRRMVEEQAEYYSYLETLPLRDALAHASEFAARDDIIINFQYFDLDEGRAGALLRSPSPLADVMAVWQQADTGQEWTVEQVMTIAADQAIQRDAEKARGAAKQKSRSER